MRKKFFVLGLVFTLLTSNIALATTAKTPKIRRAPATDTRIENGSGTVAPQQTPKVRPSFQTDTKTASYNQPPSFESASDKTDTTSKAGTQSGDESKQSVPPTFEEAGVAETFVMPERKPSEEEPQKLPDFVANVSFRTSSNGSRLPFCTQNNSAQPCDSDYQVAVSDDLYVDVTIKNIGTAPLDEGCFDIQFSHEANDDFDSDYWNFSQTYCAAPQIELAIDPSESYTFTKILPYSPRFRKLIYNPHSFYAVVDSANSIEELDESNNESEHVSIHFIEDEVIKVDDFQVVGASDTDVTLTWSDPYQTEYTDFSIHYFTDPVYANPYNISFYTFSASTDLTYHVGFPHHDDLSKIQNWREADFGEYSRNDEAHRNLYTINRYDLALINMYQTYVVEFKTADGQSVYSNALRFYVEAETPKVNVNVSSHDLAETTVLTGATGKSFYNFSILPDADVRVNKVTFTIAMPYYGSDMDADTGDLLNSETKGANFTNIKIVDADTGEFIQDAELSPDYANEDYYTDVFQVLTFENIGTVLSGGVARNFSLVMDTANNPALDGQQVVLYLIPAASYIDIEAATSYEAEVDLDTSGVSTGNPVEIQAPWLGAILASLVNSATYQTGTINVPTVSFILTADWVSDVTLTGLTLQGYFDDDLDGDFDDAGITEIIDSVMLYDSAGAFIDGVVAQVASDGSVTFTGLNWNIPGNSPQNIVVKVDLKDVPTLGSEPDRFAFDLAELEALDVNDNPVQLYYIDKPNGGNDPEVIVSVIHCEATAASCPVK